jgi:hypothetical protein
LLGFLLWFFCIAADCIQFIKENGLMCSLKHFVCGVGGVVLGIFVFGLIVYCFQYIEKQYRHNKICLGIFEPKVLCIISRNQDYEYDMCIDTMEAQCKPIQQNYRDCYKPFSSYKQNQNCDDILDVDYKNCRKTNLCNCLEGRGYGSLSDECGQ